MRKVTSAGILEFLRKARKSALQEMLYDVFVLRALLGWARSPLGVEDENRGFPITARDVLPAADSHGL
jgi:hypothetical protein